MTSKGIHTKFILSYVYTSSKLVFVTIYEHAYLWHMLIGWKLTFVVHVLAWQTKVGFFAICIHSFVLLHNFGGQTAAKFQPVISAAKNRAAAAVTVTTRTECICTLIHFTNDWHTTSGTNSHGRQYIGPSTSIWCLTWMTSWQHVMLYFWVLNWHHFAKREVLLWVRWERMKWEYHICSHFGIRRS